MGSSRLEVRVLLDEGRKSSWYLKSVLKRCKPREAAQSLTLYMGGRHKLFRSVVAANGESLYFREFSIGE